MKLDLVILCVFSLSFISLTLSSSPPTNSSETSCPMDLNYVLIRIPFNISSCQNFNPPPNITLKDLKNNSCCVVLLSLFGIGLARRLKETSFFNLPDLPTSKSCLQDFQSKLTELSFSPNLVSYCFDPMQFVITPNTCAHIETTHDWVAKVGDSTPLDSACKPNLTDVSACDACVAAGFQAQSLLLRIDGNNSHATDCFYFAVLYAAGIVNQYGAESDGAISCIMGMGLTLGTNTPGSKKISQTKKVVGSLVGAICALVAVGMGICLYPRKQKHSSRGQSPNTVVMHPCHSGDQEAVKIISTQVLRTVTNNFSEENILGRGGFGTVYKGELHDGTKIAVKRMESSIMNEKASAEFKSEIAVLTKVRHRNLTALLGYSLDGNERLLVYEYMPQGTLGRHLFNWKEEGLKPLEWTGRLTIALDVARGLEYLHGLSRQSFIHRDLKPSNILLGDDMHAKIADFGLVRLVPDGKNSVVTRIVGTFGYLAPEYGVTGRVTTKVDVFSFGIILMELITGRKALDETQSEDSLHVVPWFRRMHINKDTFQQAIDPTIELDEDTLASISTVAELAGHCSAGHPNQRPDMGHVVNVLSSLAEIWKPAEPVSNDSNDMYGTDSDMTISLELIDRHSY